MPTGFLVKGPRDTFLELSIVKDVLLFKALHDAAHDIRSRATG